MSENTDTKEQEATAENPATDGDMLNPSDQNLEALTDAAGKLHDPGHLNEGDSIPEKTIEQLQVLTDQNLRLNEELAAVNAELAKLQAAVKAAKAEPKTERAPKPAKARAVHAGAVKGDVAAELAELPAGRERHEALLEAIRAAETVEIVFGDGKRELGAIDPVRVTGDAWRVSIVGVQLAAPALILHGPQTGKPGFALAGYGLFLDGELAAYADRGGQLTLGGGSSHNVAPDIVFQP